MLGNPGLPGKGIQSVIARRSITGFPFAMKPMVLVPPLVALAAGAAWFGSLRWDSATLERSNTKLRERIRLARPADGTHSGQAGDADAKKDLSIKDWKTMADALITENAGGMPDVRLILRLRQRIAAMNPQEIVAVMNEIAASDIPKAQSEALRNLLAGVLSEKDPKAYLDTCADQLSGDGFGMGWPMVSAFQKWMKQDAAEATAWMDRMIAEGKFESKALDGKNRTRLNFEGELISSLLASDPASATARLSVIAEDQRLELILQNRFESLKPGTEKSYADMVRNCLPPDQQADAFPQVVRMATTDNGFEKVSAFFDTIEANPKERQSLAGKAASGNLHAVAAAGNLNRAAVDEMRGWAEKQAPGAVDAITGQALAAATDPDRASLTTVVMAENFRKSAEIIDALHAESDSDELLVSFLKDGLLRRHPQECAAMAGKIQDAKRRAEILGKLEPMLNAEP